MIKSQWENKQKKINGANNKHPNTQQYCATFRKQIVETNMFGRTGVPKLYAPPPHMCAEQFYEVAY